MKKIPPVRRQHFKSTVTFLCQQVQSLRWINLLLCRIAHYFSLYFHFHLFGFFELPNLKASLDSSEAAKMSLFFSIIMLFLTMYVFYQLLIKSGLFEVFYLHLMHSYDKYVSVLKMFSSNFYESRTQVFYVPSFVFENDLTFLFIDSFTSIRHR